jgi:hypothetical protein
MGYDLVQGRPPACQDSRRRIKGVPPDECPVNRDFLLQQLPDRNGRIDRLIVPELKDSSPRPDKPDSKGQQRAHRLYSDICSTRHFLGQGFLQLVRMHGNVGANLHGGTSPVFGRFGHNEL